jgi:large subunit ribosomal protein L13
MRTKTFVTTPADVQRQWWVVDAEGQTLGRLATKIAMVLRGKHKPTYSPHIDTGDYVVVVNCEKLVVSGNRMDDKKYFHYSGYHGGMKEITLRRQLQEHPERVIEAAVKGMLPDGPLGRHMFDKLKVYTGPEHPHQPQNPQVLELN